MTFCRIIAAAYHHEVLAAPSAIYHWTHEHAAISILEHNKFELQTWLGGDSDRPKDDKRHFFYLSTTRDPSRYDKGSVVFVLDGDKIAHSFHTSPFDYWGAEYRKADPSSDEHEERIWSDESEIKNAKQYIREIHAYWREETGLEYQQNAYRWHRQLTYTAKRDGVPIYWYNDFTDMRTLDKSKAKKFSDFPSPGTAKPEKSYPDSVGDYAQRQWMALYNLYYAKTEDQLSADAKLLLKDAGWHRKDVVTRYTNYIHNSRSTRNYRPFVEKIVKILKKEQLDSIDALIGSLVTKFSREKK